MLVLVFSACTHSRPAGVSWGSFDPDERRPVAAGHVPFRGELEVGATYEAFAALEPTPPPGQLRIVASRYAPEYFPANIHWRNGADALEAIEPGEWHSVVFDVVTVTESPVDQHGSIAWVPEYECDLEAIAPVPLAGASDEGIRPSTVGHGRARDESTGITNGSKVGARADS